MSGLITAALSALAGVLSTLFVQIFLRKDEARRAERKRLLDALAVEQRLHERVAYRSRKWIVEHFHGKKNGEVVEVDRYGLEVTLFSDIHEESQLVSLCAEFEAVKIDTDQYSKASHHFRRRCLDVCLCVDQFESEDAAICRIICEITKISSKTEELIKRAYKSYPLFR